MRNSHRSASSKLAHRESTQRNLYSEIESDRVRTIMATAEKQLISNSNMNKVRAEDSAVHDWYRFVLSFPPHLVRSYLNKLDVREGMTVLDPFCGTGTTLVECKKTGIDSVGIEANPMAHFASMVKVNWSVKPEQLLSHAQRIGDEVDHELKKSNGLASPSLNPSEQASRLMSLDEPAQKLLLTDSISPIPLHKVLVLLDRINRSKRVEFVKYERLALAKALVTKVGNLHFGPEVGVGKPKLDPPVISSWLENIKSMANDLAVLNEDSANSLVHCADSRQILDLIAPESIDAVITSPPYPNEKDYTRTTRLESVLLGFIRDKVELRRLKQGLVRSNTRNVYKLDEDDLWVEDNQEIQSIAKQIEQRRIDLGKTSGFERLYARTAKLYFGGMKRHLADLTRVLRPGAKLAYVVGDQASYLRVMIRTGELLASIAESLGYRRIDIELFRTRLATATRVQLREEVVLLEWPG